MDSLRFRRTTVPALIVSVLAILAMLGRFDHIFVAWLRPIYNASPLTPALGRFDSAVTILADGTVQAGAAVLLYLLGVLFNARIREAGRSAVIGFAVSGTLAQVLKHLFGRARPRVTMETLLVGPTLGKSYDSFPSGHTMVTFCLAYILASRFPRYRVWFYAFAVVVAVERIICVTHFPSDVVAGALIGVLTGSLLCGTVLSRPVKRPYLSSSVSSDPPVSPESAKIEEHGP